MKQKDFSPDELKKAAELQGQAQSATREKYAKALESLQNIIRNIYNRIQRRYFTVYNRK